MKGSAAELGSSNESLPNTTGCATALLRKVKTCCMAVSQRTQTLAKKTKACAKRPFVKRAREPQQGNEEREKTNAPPSNEVVEVFKASISLRPTVEPPRNAVHQVSEACVNVDPTTQSHEIMLENIPERAGVEEIMEMRDSIDVEKLTPATHPICCEKENGKDVTAQESNEMGWNSDKATSLGEHWHLRNEEGDASAHPLGMNPDVWTTSYHEVIGIDDYFTAEDVDEILDYMPKDRNNSLWVKTDPLVSLAEVYGHWGDRYTLEVNTQEAQGQDFRGSHGESGISENSGSHPAYEESLSVERNRGNVATEGGIVKEKTFERQERMDGLEISFLNDSDVDSNSMVLVSAFPSAHSPERKSVVGTEDSVLRVQGLKERRAADNGEMNGTVWRGMRLFVVAAVCGLLIVRWFYVYRLLVFY